MNRLVVLTFPDQNKIEETVRALQKIRSERNIKLYGSAVVAKDADGKFSVREITTEGTGGTKTAALIGAIAGAFAGPAAAAIMATGGAVVGNAADMSAQDDFNEFADGVAARVAPGGAAVVADVTEEGVGAFEIIMQGLGATTLLSS